MSNENESQVKDITDLARMSNAIHSDRTEAPIAIVKNDYRVEDLEKLQERPRRIRETINLNTVESFIDYLKAWGAGNSVIFADETQRTLRAVIDYHEDDESPTWGTHIAAYGAKISRELKAWTEKAGSPLPQIIFAEFIEDRLADVVVPDGADLLERVLKLQIMTKGAFGSAIRLQTGEFSLQYSEEQEKGTVELPEKMSLGIPLFHGGKPYKVDVRLRYRLHEGKVSFIYKLIDIDRLIEHAFAEVVQQVASGLPSISIYQGGAK